MTWAERRIGFERCKNAYRINSFVKHNIPIAFGTDWPVESLNPLLGIYAATTRQSINGKPKGGWFPDEKISMERAIEAYTLGSAYAEFAEHKKGSIEAGKLADIVVLSKNLLEIPASEILNTKVICTIVDGKIVYRKD
jgi:predicted amidohydrolase YtcJ